MSIAEKAKKLDSVATYVFFVGLAVSILGFLPIAGLPLSVTKAFFVLSLSTVGAVLWLIARSVDGVFLIPRTKAMFVYPALLLSGALSTFFSGNVNKSFIGNFETTTFFFLVALLLVSFLVLVLARNKEQSVFVYGIVVLCYIPVALLTVVRVIFDGVPTLQLLGKVTDTLVGSWTDLGLLTALVVMIVLIAREHVPLKPNKKIFTTILLIFGLVVAVMLNVPLAWMYIGLGALLSIVFVLLVSKHALESENNNTPEETMITPLGALLESRKRPYASYIVLFVSLFFLFTTHTLGNTISNLLNVSHIEVRPSFVSTMEVGVQSFGDKPLFGEGLNRFTILWDTYKPHEVLRTEYWQVEFPLGFGYIPTMIVTSGVLGALVWVAMTLLVLFMFIRPFIGTTSLFRGKKNFYLHISSYILGLLSFISLIVYAPSPAILLVCVVLLTMYISHYVISETTMVKVTILKSKRTLYAGIAGLSLTILALVYGGVIVVRHYIANVHTAHALVYAAQGNILASENAFVSAGRYAKSDTLYFSLSQISIARMNALLQQLDRGEEILPEDFKRSFSLAEQFAITGVSYDQFSYRNWIFLGDLYKASLPFGVEGAYESAKVAYGKARILTDKAPEVLLRLATLEASQKNIADARRYAELALADKPNYLDALLFLIVLERDNGNVDKAQELELVAVQAYSNSATLFFELGLLAYNAKEMERAVAYLERAHLLNENFGNAAYMLAVAYEGAGMKEKAIEELMQLQKKYPDNTDILSALARIQSGGTILVESTPVAEELLPTEETSEPTL